MVVGLVCLGFWFVVVFDWGWFELFLVEIWWFGTGCSNFFMVWDLLVWFCYLFTLVCITLIGLFDCLFGFGGFVCLLIWFVLRLFAWLGWFGVSRLWFVDGWCFCIWLVGVLFCFVTYCCCRFAGLWGLVFVWVVLDWLFVRDCGFCLLIWLVVYLLVFVVWLFAFGLRCVWFGYVCSCLFCFGWFVWLTLGWL